MVWACASIGGQLCALTYVLLPLFPVWVLPDGLRGYDFFGRYRFVRWAEIREAKHWAIVGLPYLAIHAESLARPITLPLWLRDRAGFDALVAAGAGGVNPLTLALRGPEAMLADITTNCYYLERTANGPAVDSATDPPLELPADLVDCVSLAKSLVVCAIREHDDMVVGMGAGWVLKRQSGELLLLVKAAEVNDPYAASDLRRRLIDGLIVFAKTDGISAVYFAKDLGMADQP